MARAFSRAGRVPRSHGCLHIRDIRDKSTQRRGFGCLSRHGGGDVFIVAAQFALLCPFDKAIHHEQ